VIDLGRTAEQVLGRGEQQVRLALWFRQSGEKAKHHLVLRDSAGQRLVSGREPMRLPGPSPVVRRRANRRIEPAHRHATTLARPPLNVSIAQLTRLAGVICPDPPGSIAQLTRWELGWAGGWVAGVGWGGQIPGRMAARRVPIRRAEARPAS